MIILDENKKTKKRTRPKRTRLTKDEIAERQGEWNEVEALVLAYQKQFESNPSIEQIKISKDSALELLHRFYPYFYKYVILIKSSRINYQDNDLRFFVYSFISEMDLKEKIKNKKKLSIEDRSRILDNFQFIRKTYGAKPAEEILVDINIVFLGMCKKYKSMGRNFCGYLYNVFKYEMMRFVSDYIREPMSIPYRHITYEEYMASNEDDIIVDFEESFYTENMGVPDYNWLRGITCSADFWDFDYIKRRILVEYYLEEKTDQEISELIGLTRTRVMRIRQEATQELSEKCGGLVVKPMVRKKKSKL